MQELIYSPSEAAALAIQALEDLRQHRGIGIKTGISDLDKILLPLRPGELCTILGYTSWYKSGFMNWLLKATVSQCNSSDIAIKVTWEDSVEEDTLKWVSSDAGIPIGIMVRGEELNWDLIMKSYQKRIETPLWLIGHSNSVSSTTGKARPRMTMTDVLQAVNYICDGVTDQKFKPRLIVLDYLQRIRPDGSDGNTKREQMMEAVNKSKDLGIQIGCPVVLGVQAGRSVLERDYKLPRLEDGLETSNIEQSSDKVLSLWYPIKTENEGKFIEIDKVTVNEHLLICGVMKQKMGVSPVSLPLYVDPALNILGNYQREESQA
jgi:replicative DNA helicase